MYLDFMVCGLADEPLILSYFNRSQQEVRAFATALDNEKRLSYRYRIRRNVSGFSSSFAAITRGKEKFYHGTAVANNLSEKYFVTTKENCYRDLYYLLMNKFNLPLLERWMPEIYEELMRTKKMVPISRNVKGNQERMLPLGDKNVQLKDILWFYLELTEQALGSIVTQLFERGVIWITKKEQKKLEFKNLDEYFQQYGSTIVDNLKSILHPVSELNGKIDKAVLNTMRLYPQQAAMVNGACEYFSRKKGDYILFAMGMGSGKTIQAATAAEMFYVGKWLKAHPGKTLADAYEKDGVINYRHFIMCPGHLVEKWYEELKREIPYAKPVIVDSFRQLVQLRAGGKERVHGKEFYILSKDFLKLSYQRIPTPRKEGVRYIEVLKCKDCGMIHSRKTDECIGCGGKNIQPVKTKYKASGLICPHCNRLLFPENVKYDLEDLGDMDTRQSLTLKWSDMSEERANNQTCVYCGESLWQPFVKNLNTEFGYNRQPHWFRQTFWANKAKKGRRTMWVLRGMEAEAEQLYGEVLNSMEDSMGGCRKYAPSVYIKKYLKGYIDVFICDEVHKAKGGSTAQGAAFHHIRKASKYTFGLTGTIAGGYATDLFYLLYRLDPARMKAKGYSWESEMQFAKDYGCIETEYEPVVNVRLNSCSRGAQRRAPRTLPGISPMIFSEFLLDRAVFLDVSDMSEHMPPLHEIIRLVKPKRDAESTMFSEYNGMLENIKQYGRENEVNLSSIKNQLAMSYLDKPYGVDEILDPSSGEMVVRPPDYSSLVKDDGLLAKEEELVNIVRAELSEGRNCVVFAEYTQSESTNILPRLKEVLERECFLENKEVVIMKASSPQASKREKWMHSKARAGMKVLLCNPRLCETGLDFCWREDGVLYNYPTLIFYQAGYSLFVMWQASGRAWRLNQKEECRTYYLGYEKTVQQAILQVLGEKKAATAAIQGRFSAEGLAAMAQGVDTQVRIAQIMSEIDTHTVNQLQKMFDVVTGTKEKLYDDGPTMKLFSEITRSIQTENNGSVQMSMDSLLGAFDLFQMSGQEKNHKEAEIPVFFQELAHFNVLFNMERTASYELSDAPVKKKRAKKEKHGECVSIFDYI